MPRTSKRSARQAPPTLADLPGVLLERLFGLLPAFWRPAFAATCSHLRQAACQARGRALLSRALTRRHPRHRFRAATSPGFMAGLSKVELLHLELDASAPCVVAADVLGALCALLDGLPHCSPASAAPQLRLLIGVPLVRPLPELEASALQNLLAGIGLLPRLTSVQFVIGPSFTLDGGLAELLSSARVTAERHLLLDGPRVSPLYPELQRLTLQFETSEGLEAFAALAAGGCLPTLRELGLIKGLVENPLPAGLSWDPLSADMRDRVLAQLTSDHEQRVEAGEWEEAFGSEPPSLAEVMGGLLDLTASYPGELSQDLYDAYDELAAAASSGRQCLDAARDGWCSFLQQNCEISRADFLLSFPLLTSLRLTNFNTGPEGELVVRLPKLPSLRSLAISTEEQCRGQAGYEPAPGGPTFFEELAVALPSLSSLSIEWASTDQGISKLQGLTTLTIMQPCSSEGADPYDSFKWDICRLPALQELHLRGGNASWTSFLQAEDFTHMPSLRQLVFDMREWPASLPNARVAELLRNFMWDLCDGMEFFPKLESIHAVLEEGPYLPASVAAELAQEQLRVSALVQDAEARLWGAFWCRQAGAPVLAVREVSLDSVVTVRGFNG